MIDSSKKQQQGFPEILTAGDFEPLKEKECLEGSNQKSLKEGQCVCGLEANRQLPLPVSQAERCLSAYHSVCIPPSTPRLPLLCLSACVVLCSCY